MVFTAQPLESCLQTLFLDSQLIRVPSYHLLSKQRFTTGSCHMMFFRPTAMY